MTQFYKMKSMLLHMIGMDISVTVRLKITFGFLTIPYFSLIIIFCE